MNPNDIRYSKLWRFPSPKSNYQVETFSTQTNDLTCSQQKYYDEYYTTGHKIYDPAWYKDISIYETGSDGKEKFKEFKYVERQALPIQKECIDIVLAHFLGNPTQFTDSTVGENKTELMAQYKESWAGKNMETFRNQFVKSALTVGDVAGMFYYDGNILKWKVFSFLDNEQIYVKNDKYGEIEYFGRFYSIMEAGNLVAYCDIIDKSYSTTFSQKETALWTQVSSGLHGFKQIPVVYNYRKGGAFWTPAQNLIDSVEVMISELSEDNHSKTRALYHIASDKPTAISSESGIDTVVTAADGKFSMIQGADISTQFEATYAILMERIMNVLGMVYPKSKSSGDLPTGSMKMMFYPTERVVLQLIHEFNEPLDKINSLFKEGMIKEHPELATELLKLNVTASISMFTPQDEAATMQAYGLAKSYGSLSDLTISQKIPNAAPDEYARLESQKKAAADLLAEQNAQIAIDTPPVPAKPKPKV